MCVNSLPKTVTLQRRGCNLNQGPSAPESNTQTTRLPSHPNAILKRDMLSLCVYLCSPVYISVASRYCTEKYGRVELVFGMKVSYSVSYKVL